tara:strand:- start:77 stop:484 length:408 start_codon:yes stop_codon:yes gene_type:complete
MRTPQAVKLIAKTQNEIDELVNQEKEPEDYLVLECAALNIQAVPQPATFDDGLTKHKCLPFVIQFVVPIDAMKVFQTSLYVSPEMQSSGALKKSMPIPPSVRIMVKKDALVESFLAPAPIDASLIDSILKGDNND